MTAAIRITALVAAVICCGVQGPPAAADQPPIPEALRDYIRQTQAATTFLEIPKPVEGRTHESITRDQAQQDVAMIRYLFDNAYSGKEYWEGRGVGFGSMYRALEAWAASAETLAVADIGRLIQQHLAGVRDGHLAIEGAEKVRFYTHRDAYFSDLVLEEREGRYFVLASGCDAVSEGRRYTGGADSLFPTLSPTGKRHYLLGLLSDRFETEMQAAFDGEVIAVPLHTARIAAARPVGTQVFEHQTIEGIPVVRVGDFFGRSHEALLRYADLGKDLRKEKCFVLDITGNPGGNSHYSQSFFENLNGVAHWLTAGAMLFSPPIVQCMAAWDDDEAPTLSMKQMIWDARSRLDQMRSAPVRAWQIVRDGDRQRTGSYPGTSILVVNRKVASSGEATVAYSRSVPHDIVIGENTAGIGTFGDIRTYMLPNSGILLQLPRHLFVTPACEEGLGFRPDYWLDSAEPVGEIVRWLNHPADYEFRPQMPGAIHDVDFENFVNGVPEHALLEIGASTGIAGEDSEVAQDSEIFFKGSGSLRLSATSSTTRFYSLSIRLPDGAARITASYAVRGEALRAEAGQFDDAYLGFIYSDGSGGRCFQVKDYRGTFDWKTDQVELGAAATQARDITFTIFLAISGNLWVDDLRFEMVE